MSIGIGELEILLRADVARLQRDMDSARRVVGDSTRSMSQAADRAKAALAGIAAGIGLSQLVQMSDAYAKFTAQLKLASLSAREYTAAFADVKRISTQSTQGLQETGTLYARIANGTRELGTTQKQVAAITETVNLALLVSGATASEAASAQLQLSQAFASGTLRGEEFNAVNEAAPRLMLALADGIGVPVGALKKMAEAGEITSQIMAETLPNALAKLREEGKEVQTISGAFTVLKNNMMEFVGVQSNASGAVAAFTGALRLISTNLSLIAGAMATVIAVKLANWLVAMTTETLAAAAAKRALATATLANAVSTTQAAAVIAAAKLAEAQANVRVTASAAAVSAARVVELRAAVMAAQGAVALAIATNGLIPAQARALALAEANTVALAAQAVAAGAATTASIAATGALGAQAAAATLGARAMGVLNATMAFFGGPIGLIITLLGAAATAWMVFGNKAKEANDKVAASLDESTTEMIARLDKQIEKLKERNRLQDQEPRIRGLTDLSDADRDGLARAKAAMDANRAKPMTGQTQLDDIELAGRYETALKRVAQVQDEVAAAETRGRDGKLKDWYAQNGTAAQKLAAELEVLRKQFGTIPPEMEKLVRAKYADKGAARIIQQEATAYQSLVTAIGEKIAAGNLEMNGYERLSDAQKMTIKLDEAIASGKNKLTPKHIADARALIATVAAQDEVIESQKRAIAGAEQWEKIAKEREETSAKAIANANQEADRNEELARTLGMTKGAIEALELARLQEQYAQRASSAMTLKEIEDLELLIDAKTRSAAAMIKIDDFEEQKKVWESIDKTAHDTFVSIFDSGKSAFDRLRDTLKNGLLDMLYQMTIKKWIFNISAAVTGGSTGALAQAAGLGGAGAGGSSILSLASAAKSAYTAISAGFAGVAASVGAGLSTLGGVIGSSTIGAFGAGLGLTGAQAAAAASAYGAAGMAGTGSAISAGAAAAPFVGAAAGIAAGYFGGRAISGGYSVSGGSGNSTVNAGTGIGGAVGAFLGGPIGVAIGSALGGLIGGAANRLFGHKAKEYGDTTLNGAFGANGFSGTSDSSWLKKGGVFRSDKRGVDKTNLDATTIAQFTAGYDMIKTASADFASVLGISADALTTRTQSLSIKLGKDQAENEAAVAKFFVDVADKIARELLPSLGQFTKAGESASVTLQRIASNYAFVDVALESIGKTFGSVGVGSVAARERMLELSGGLENFGRGAAFFAQNFMSEAERMAPVAASVRAALAGMGLSFVDTRAEFKAVVQGLDITTAGGATTYASLMKLQEGFAQTHPEIEAVSNSLQELTDLQRQYDELTMTASQLLKKQRDALDPSNRALFDQVQALRAMKDAQDATKSSLGDVITRMKSFGDAARALKDGLLTGSLSTLTPEQQYAELRRQYETTKSAAFGGDEKAQGNLSSIATAFLTASQKINGGDSMYSADFAGVLKTADEIAQWSAGQIDVAQASLNAQEAQLAAMTQMNSTMSSVANSLMAGDYSGVGTSAMAPLVEQIKSLQAEVAGLRADQNAQTGAQIQSNAEVTLRAADIAAEGAVTAAGSMIWQNKNRGELD